MIRPNPQSGELWQHFKGNKYWIIGKALKNPSINSITERDEKYVIYSENWSDILFEIFFYNNFIVKDTEEELLYRVSFHRTYEILHLFPVSNIGIRHSIGWARPLEMFMDNLEQSKGGGYRFTKLEI